MAPTKINDISALLEPRSLAVIEDLPDCEGYFVSKDLEITRTSGFELV